jgi:AraC-like DNA-binding protein
VDYFVRSGAFEGLAELIVELGGDPAPVLLTAGIEPAALGTADGRLPYRQFLVALEAAAKQTARPDFGLQLALKQSFSMLGAVGFAMREAPTIATAIDDLCYFFHTHMNGAKVRLERRRDHALWAYEITMPDPPAFAQQIDLSAGVGVGIIRQLTHRDWAPELVYLEREKPRSTAAHEAFFKAPILYGQEVTAFVLKPELLDQRIAHANIQLHNILHEYLTQRAIDTPSGFLSTVRECIWRRLRGGGCNIDDVATDLQITRRTFQRKLSAEAIAFKDLLEETRMEMANGCCEIPASRSPKYPTCSAIPNSRCSRAHSSATPASRRGAGASLASRTTDGRQHRLKPQARSNTAARPWPPPMHMVSKP